MSSIFTRVLLSFLVVCGLCLFLGWQSGLSALAQDANEDSAVDTNGISQPAEGEVVSGTIDLRGVATDPNFEKWQIDLLPFGEAEDATSIDFRRQRRPSDSFFTTLDTTRYPDGTHQLRLRVVRDDFNYDEYLTMFVIDNSDGTSGLESGITNPDEGETVSRDVRVRGFAFDPGSRAWQLDLLPFGEAENATFLARRGNRQFPRERLFDVLDTTQYPDGTHVLRLRTIFSDTSYNEYFTTITIDNSMTPTSVNNGILDPEEGETVSGITPVRGIADHPDFVKWQLDLLLSGDEESVRSLVVNNNPRSRRRQLTRLDTSNYPDGTHVLRLRVVRGDYNYDEYFTTIVIDNSETDGEDASSN